MIGLSFRALLKLREFVPFLFGSKLGGRIVGICRLRNS